MPHQEREVTQWSLYFAKLTVVAETQMIWETGKRQETSCLKAEQLSPWGQHVGPETSYSSVVLGTIWSWPKFVYLLWILPRIFFLSTRPVWTLWTSFDVAWEKRKHITNKVSIIEMGFYLWQPSRSGFITAPRTLFNKICSPGAYLRNIFFWFIGVLFILFLGKQICG